MKQLHSKPGTLFLGFEKSFTPLGFPSSICSLARTDRIFGAKLQENEGQGSVIPRLPGGGVCERTTPANAAAGGQRSCPAPAQRRRGRSPGSPSQADARQQGSCPSRRCPHSLPLGSGLSTSPHSLGREHPSSLAAAPAGWVPTRWPSPSLVSDSLGMGGLDPSAFPPGLRTSQMNSEGKVNDGL